MSDFLQLAGSYCSNTWIFIGAFKIITVASKSRGSKTHFMPISSGKTSSVCAVRENSPFRLGEERCQTIPAWLIHGVITSADKLGWICCLSLHGHVLMSCQTEERLQRGGKWIADSRRPPIRAEAPIANHYWASSWFRWSSAEGCTSSPFSETKSSLCKLAKDNQQVPPISVLHSLESDLLPIDTV